MINSVVITGRLTKDPERRTFPSGATLASFRVACDDSRKGPNGEKTTLFINVSAWGQLADTVIKYMKKGSLVGVTGRLTSRKYTNKAGVESEVVEINASSVEFLESKNAKEGSDSYDSGYASDSNGYGSSDSGSYSQQTSQNLDTFDPVDQDLPF